MNMLTPGKRYTLIDQVSARAHVLFSHIQKDEQEKHIVIVPTIEKARSYERIGEKLYGTHVCVVQTKRDLYEMITHTSGVYVATVDIFFQEVPTQHILRNTFQDLAPGDEMEQQVLTEWLADNGYRVSHGEGKYTYHREGDSLHVQTQDAHMVISFFGNEIDEIYERIDEDHLEKVVSAYLPSHHSDLIHASLGVEVDFHTAFLRDISAQWWIVGLDFYNRFSELIDTRDDSIILQDMASHDSHTLPYHAVTIGGLPDLQYFAGHTKGVTFRTQRPDVIKKFLASHGLEKVHTIEHIRRLKSESFMIMDDVSDTGPHVNIQDQVDVSFEECVLSDDVLSHVFVKKRTKTISAKHLDLLIQIQPGDYVVHLYHGIGKYAGMTKKTLGETTREYLEIHYAAEDKLFVPIEEVYRVSKYIGDDNPKLTRLGKEEWKKTLHATQKEVKDIADDLLEHHAKQKLAKGYIAHPFPEKEAAFQAAFPHAHTPDQLQAIDEILEDMGSRTSMDRLLTGDVGFGKTEVAMHAIYRAFLNGRQSMLLTPLVVLAYEHYEACLDRLRSLGVNIAILSRLSTTKEFNTIKSGLKDGSIHLVVGTHRLLSKELSFDNLGLIVVDEEHKFGVEEKEVISKIKYGVDTLTMSATPIPRSLNIALSGLKKISILSTPPQGKQPISTIVGQYSPDVIRSAVLAEFDRGGKVFFVHNRVETLETMKQVLQECIGPKAKIITTHGQMGGQELEDRILAFKMDEYNILLTTTVIENGINFLDTNTIFINDAERFGLAQLHQLRGRVGRGKIHGYCYLLYNRNELPEDGRKRLITIANNTHLGAGFEIAMRDMEIRGAGDILGIKQSGKTKQVGVNFYLKLLEQTIESLKKGGEGTKIECRMDLGLSVYIPDDFFDSDTDKLTFYRRLESVSDQAELTYAREQFLDEHGEIPDTVENFFCMMEAKVFFESLRIKSIKKQVGNYVIEFDDSAREQDLRALLEKDTDQNIVVINMKKVKLSQRAFPGGVIQFLSYLT